jgi:hypothetical protein
MKSSLWSLQVALYNRLKNDVAISAKAKVYDAVPDTTVFPYITLGEDTVIPYDSKTFDGEEITHTLHVWSQYKGKKEVKEIMSLIIEAVIKSPLSLDGGFFVEFTRVDFMQVFDDPSDIKHGVIRFRFKISQL